MKQYKHKQTGNVATETNSGKNYRVSEPRNFTVPKWMIENSSEWEEIKEKEWGIVSIKNIGFDQILSDKINIKAWLEGNGQEYWNIHSVKRFSDGEVFTVGDNVKMSNKEHGQKIKGFELTEDSIRFCFTDGCGASAKYFSNIDDIKHYKEKKPLFTTEDGVEVYEEEGCWGVCIKEHSSEDIYKLYSLCSDIGLYGKPDEKYWKTFSTKEKAEQYIEENRPKYSEKDIKELFYRYTDCNMDPHDLEDFNKWFEQNKKK